MDALSLYKYVTNNDVEFHYELNEGEVDVLLFPSIWQMEEFVNLFKSSNRLADEGIECMLRDGYFAFWMKEVCEYHGIELEEVFGIWPDELKNYFEAKNK